MLSSYELPSTMLESTTIIIPVYSGSGSTAMGYTTV